MLIVWLHALVKLNNFLCAIIHRSSTILDSRSENLLQIIIFFPYQFSGHTDCHPPICYQFIEESFFLQLPSVFSKIDK